MFSFHSIDIIMIHQIFRGVNKIFNKKSLFARLLFWVALEDEGGDIAEKHSRGNTSRRCGESSRQYADGSLLLNSFLHTLGERIAKARQGRCCSATRKFDQGLVKTETREDNTRHNVGNKDTGGIQLCFVYENLGGNTEEAAYNKRFYKIHSESSFKVNEMGDSGDRQPLLNAGWTHQCSRADKEDVF